LPGRRAVTRVHPLPSFRCRPRNAAGEPSFLTGAAMRQPSCHESGRIPARKKPAAAKPKRASRREEDTIYLCAALGNVIEVTGPAANFAQARTAAASTAITWHVATAFRATNSRLRCIQEKPEGQHLGSC
jgi:hypothetical protein